MEIEKRYSIEIGEPSSVRVILVGCGGTGSFLALHLARLAYHARDRYGLGIRLIFVDPDVVEARNIGRQNFAPAEIGMPKAWSLMERFNRAFGLDIVAHVGRFDRSVLDTLENTGLTILVGCVDNASARRAIHEAVIGAMHRIWWLDCGNHDHSGQVLLGNRTDLKKPEISPLGFCTGLPLPSVQHPELLEPEAEEVPGSCADLTLADIQGLMVNQAVASFAAQYVYRMLLTRDLDVYATYFDLRTGSARSVGITESGEEVRNG